MTPVAKHFRHITWTITAILVLCSTVCPAAEEEVVEIRQGGYVERLAPGVDFKDRLPRIAPREPADSMAAFHIIPGVRMEQVAAEPLARDVVDMVFDENGRLFIAELIIYSELEQEGKLTHSGRVSMLEDTDGDGRFDKSTIYIDGLTWPAGLVPFDGGLFVANSPTLIYCKDTNGDGRADFQETILSGFDNSNPNACPNSLRFGLDNRIHGMASTSGGKLLAEKWAAGDESRQVDPIEARGRDFSFHARTGQMRLESGGSQFGMTFDPWGRKFESSNSVPIEEVMYSERYIARNPYLVAPAARLRIYADGSSVYRTSPAEPWRILRTELRIDGAFSGPVEGGGTPAGYFTAASGVHVFEGTALPEQFRGNVFVAEGSGNLIHRMRLENKGLALTAHRVEQNTEFLTSDEIWFRPIQFADGPDGALYVADMYREIFEHPDAVPPSARKYLNVLAGNDRGRVYRFVSEDFQQPKPVHLGSLSTAELVALLAHPNGWHRNTAARLLYERQDRRAIGPLVKLAAESDSALGRMHSMYALDGLGMLSEDVVLARLDDPHPGVREHAVRLAEVVLADAPSVRAKLYTMADDADARVRYQLAFTLGDISGDQATAALAAIATRDVADRWIRLAIVSSSYARAGDLVTLLADNAQWRATKNGRTFLEEMAEQAGLQDRNDQVAQVFTLLETIPDDEKTLVAALVRGLGRGLEKSGNPLKAQLASGGKAGQAMAAMVDRAKLQAIDAQLPLDQRVAAVRSLALAPLDEAVDVLGDLLDGRQTQEIQVAAIQALGRFQDDAVAELIVEEWSGFTPHVRAEAAETLFARAERLSTLLDAVDDGLILPSQLDPARVRFLLNHANERIRARAEEVLGGVELARREEVVEAYQSVLEMKGEAAKGKELFKKECSTCHRLEGVGYDLGLPLNTVGNKGPEAILLAVLDPNRDVLPQYLNYVVVTDDGLSLTGMIHSETATSITLRRAEGESDSVLRTRIDEMVNSGLSVMPEGLEEQLDKQAMADVIAYLMSLE